MALTETEKFMDAMKEVDAIQQLVESARHMFSSSVIQQNDSSSEYVISTVKHFYDKYVILQYGIKNTLEDQVLTKVNLKLNGLETAHGLKVSGIIPLADGDSIKYDQQKFVYLVLDKQGASVPYPHAKVQQSLTLEITEIDVETEDEVGSYEEDYDVDEVQIATRDYMKADLIPNGQFKEFWETIGSHPKCAETSSTFALPFKNFEDAVEGVVKSFGMSTCDGSNKVNATEKVHNMLLSGLFLNKEMVLVRGMIGFN